MVVEWRKERRPLAVQVRDLIWNMLKDEKYLPGDRLPSEMEMVERFGISRAALREALKILEEERVLLCQHGVGRFVAPRLAGVLQEDLSHLKSVSELAASLGITFTSEVLSARRQPAEASLAALLSLPDGAPVMALERVWREEGCPLIYSVDYFDGTLPGLPAGDMEPFAGSLLSLLEAGGRRLAYSKTTVRAVHLETVVAERLETSDNSPWILLEQINFDQRGGPILYSKDYYCSDKFQFFLLRRRR
jgi:GntR family transcriptional regulator